MGGKREKLSKHSAETLGDSLQSYPGTPSRDVLKIKTDSSNLYEACVKGSPERQKSVNKWIGALNYKY